MNEVAGRPGAGLTEEQLATIPITFRNNACLNPNAQFHQAITLDDYKSNRYVAEPFHLYDCCPVSDGAAAVIVTSAERARSLKKPPVYVMGFGQGVAIGAGGVVQPATG